MAKRGFTAGSKTRVYGYTEQKPSLPPERPLPMPRRDIAENRVKLRSSGVLKTNLLTGLARLFVFPATFALTGYGVLEMYGVMKPGGVTGLQWVFLVLFALNFSWVCFSACQAFLGFLRTLWLEVVPRRKATNDDLPQATAVLMPVYNEHPQGVAAALAAAANGLAARAPGKFAIFILSDSNKPDAWIEEESVFRRLIENAPDGCPIYYRHRFNNTERKAGNVADWVMRWGGAYESMLILDADSIMSPENIIELSKRLHKDPGLGLIQTVPLIINGRSLYARLQQFANRCYGPIFGNGLAAWHGRSSNYWGHNAIIRTQAFADAARLPELSGPPPFGGHVLSHDFIEAAFLRRAGWGVRLDTDLKESFEQAPPALLDVIVRDRRWCQGNLQHARFLSAYGLTAASRLHLSVGIMAYLSAVLWFLLIATGLVIAVQAAVTRPEYFTAPSLFPTWPVFDSERAVALFVVSMGIVMAPKILGWLAIMLNPRELMKFGGPVALTISALTELVLSALYAPVMMIAQVQIILDILLGRDSGWSTQRRGDVGTDYATARRAHRWHMIAGAAIAVVSYQMNPYLFLWLLPISVGLLISVPLSCLSGSTRAGMLLKKYAVLRTPEEQMNKRPKIINLYEQLLGSYHSSDASALARLAEDAELQRWHTAQLSTHEDDPRAYNEPLILARAKRIRCNDLEELEAVLTTDQERALLNDAAFISSLSNVQETHNVFNLGNNLEPYTLQTATANIDPEVIPADEA